MKLVCLFAALSVAAFVITALSVAVVFAATVVLAAIIVAASVIIIRQSSCNITQEEC